MIQHRYFLIFLFLFSFAYLNAQNQHLVIFIKDTAASHGDRDFVNNYLKDIADFAAENKIEVHVQNADKGVFEQSAFTPCIYYIDEKTLSLYKGRYNETTRIFNFIRGATVLNKKEDSINCRSCFYSQNAKLSYVFPIKITELNKMRESKKLKYTALIDNAVKQSLNDFQFRDSITVPYSSRKYYLDFYPYIQGRRIYITGQAFSEFNCKKPIQAFSGPIQGRLKNLDKLIALAKVEMLFSINKEINTQNHGDAHEPISVNTPSITASDLGILFEQKNSQTQAIFPDKIADNWEFAGPLKSNIPMIQFQVPNTIYLGEVQNMDASLNLTTMKGNAFAQTSTLTMGDAGLDESVLHRILAEKYDTASVRFKKVLRGPEKAISSFETYEYLIQSDFTFVGKTIEEAIVISITPFMKNSTLFLHVQGQFDIQLMRQFGIESGVGESLEEDTVEFYINFTLKEANK